MQKGDYLVLKRDPSVPIIEDSKSEQPEKIEPPNFTPGAPVQYQHNLDMYECMICLEIKLESNACIECGAIVCKECTELMKNCPQCHDEKSKLQANVVLKKFIA